MPLVAKDIVIRISATDAASPVFKKIAGEAQAAGAQITQSNDRAAASSERFSKAGAALGVAIGSATLLMGDFAKKAADDQASTERMRQSVENTGKSYDEYAQKIDAAIKKGQEKAFTDDQTRDAIVKLNAVTNDTGKSLDQLGLAMDFARARGIDLSTSAEIIAKVYGGNIGILARYGIAVDKNATSTEALALIQQRAAGQAETYANTSAGQAAMVRDKWDEATEALGRHAGELTTLLLLLPQLRAGYAALAASGIFGGVAGVGGLGTLGSLALLVGSGAFSENLLANRDQPGGGWAENLFSRGAAGFGGVAKKLTPGSVGDAFFNSAIQNYQDILANNEAGSAAKAVLLQPGEHGDDILANRLAYLLGLPIGTPLKEMYQIIESSAAAQSLSVGGYLLSRASTNPNERVDPLTGVYQPHDVLQKTLYNRIAATDTGFNNVGLSGAPINYRTAFGTPTSSQLGDFRAGPAANAGDAAYFAQQKAATDAQNTQLELLLKYRQELGQQAVFPDRAAHFAVNEARASTALDSGFRVAVGQTSAIGQQAQGVADWADKLIGVKGTMAEIDDLYKNHIIDIKEYNAAQAAGTSIFAANAAIQNDILKIQTDQAPVIADLTAEQQRYMDHLAELTPQQQALRLAYMDTGETSQALTLQQLALSAAMGELGDNGTQIASDMIEAQAEADPYLRQLLEDMGLITVGADGTISVDFSSVEDAHGPMGDLINDLDQLIGLLAQEFGIVIDYGSVSEADQHVIDLGNHLDNLNGRHSAVTIDEVTNQITNHVDNFLTGSGGRGGHGGMHGLTMYANGGTAYDPIMPRFAGGGTWAMVGERGPELAYLSRGDQVFHTEASKSMLGRWRQRGLHVSGPITVIANDARDMEWSIREQSYGSARG